MQIDFLKTPPSRFVRALVIPRLLAQAGAVTNLSGNFWCAIANIACVRA